MKYYIPGCGVWYNNPPATDCVELAPVTFAMPEELRELLSPEAQKEKMEVWVKQYTTEKIAVYCSGCEKGLRPGGAEPVHLIELITKDLRQNTAKVSHSGNRITHSGDLE